MKWPLMPPQDDQCNQPAGLAVPPLFTKGAHPHIDIAGHSKLAMHQIKETGKISFAPEHLIVCFHFERRARLRCVVIIAFKVTLPHGTTISFKCSNPPN